MASWKVENSLDILISALCLDYWRRQKAIEERMVTPRTDTEFRYYNFKIFDAAAEIVGEKFADTYIEEIGTHTGYAKSRAGGVSEGTYKKYKRLVCDNIAKKLHLRD
ncbi:MAG: hypothetical protein E7612_07380 [Ruminococcaceae bacterium]|nr:hypothetical protein [Oscillospiraceae bacterium]